MNIGIIGAGNIGSTLGRKWATTGHKVCFGVRNPADARYDGLRAIGQVSQVDQASTFGEVVLLALPGSAAADFISQHAGTLAGKIVIDATNNVRGAEMNVLALLGKLVPGIHPVRAFSTLGWENFADPQIDGEPIDLFFCGDPASRLTMEQLIAEIGLRPIYIGNIDTAAALDGMTRLWFALVFGQGYGRRTAFKLLSEPG